MKKFYLLAMCFLYLVFPENTKAQTNGYILMNEYMPWTTQPCPAGSEFVELYNFGPGPVNIGCYMVTDGDYIITVPPNTIVLPGQFYVIAGMNSIPINCANIDYAAPVNLNWTTCNCTSGTIPSLLGGWLTDGGSANEQLVFMDPNKKIVDAVVRNLPTEISAAMTSSTVAGGCTSVKFDLDTMNINYETIGESAGRGNSFARKINGDCDWEKDPQQSGGTTNNTSGQSSSLSTVMSITNADACNSTGSISISFTNVSNYNNIFPVSYILAQDIDSNNVYDNSDTYINGTDINPSTVDISGLSQGRYRLVIQPASGCNYQFYAFTMLAPCNMTLAANSFSFNAKRTDQSVQLNWSAERAENIKELEIEKSYDSKDFGILKKYVVADSYQSFNNLRYYDINAGDKDLFYRIKIIHYNDSISFSQVRKVPAKGFFHPAIVVFPNPVSDRLNITLDCNSTQAVSFTLLKADGSKIKSQNVVINPGSTTVPLSLSGIEPGVYVVKIIDGIGKITARKFFKQ